MVILVVFEGEYAWYVTDRDSWVLDDEAWGRAFGDAGYEDTDPEHQQRFGIAVLNEDTAGEFLRQIADYRVTIEELRDALDVDGNLPLPSLLVDFDRRRQLVRFVESPAFGDYLPAGWTCREVDFLDEVPGLLRYW